jgi:hypothetical protein
MAQFGCVILSRLAVLSSSFGLIYTPISERFMRWGFVNFLLNKAGSLKLFLVCLSDLEEYSSLES